MTSDTVIDVDQLLARIQRHQLHIWSLIDAQLELKEEIKGMSRGAPAECHPMSSLLETLNSLVGQYEMRVWQIVPIQLQLRLKLNELSDIGNDLMVKQENGDIEMDVAFTDGNDSADAIDRRNANETNERIATREFPPTVSSEKFSLHDLRNELRGLHKLNDDFRSDLKSLIQSTIEDCLQQHQRPLSAPKRLAKKKKRRRESPEQIDHGPETYQPISTEQQVEEWNVRLADTCLFSAYEEHFTKLIPPKSYAGKGDSAAYLLADAFFTREFWIQFTWTGINKGNKSRQGFRSFTNVTLLMSNIIRQADPFYNMAKLEIFCKTRLFRHAKDRAESRRLRKPVCKPRRATDKTARPRRNGDGSESGGDVILSSRSS